MIVIWSPQAIEQRRTIYRYILQDNAGAAISMDSLFREAAERLPGTPHMGRPGKIAGTRELIPHASYRIVYEIEDDHVLVLALIHTARRWPPEKSRPG